jgi:hypothetical protein
LVLGWGGLEEHLCFDVRSKRSYLRHQHELRQNCCKQHSKGIKTNILHSTATKVLHVAFTGNQNQHFAQYCDKVLHVAFTENQNQHFA